MYDVNGKRWVSLERCHLSVDGSLPTGKSARAGRRQTFPLRATGKRDQVAQSLQTAESGSAGAAETETASAAAIQKFTNTYTDEESFPYTDKGRAQGRA